MFMMIFYFSRVTDLTYAKSAPGYSILNLNRFLISSSREFKNKWKKRLARKKSPSEKPAVAAVHMGGGSTFAVTGR